MENLDLNAYGVSEMTSEEMLMVEGGNPIVGFLRFLWNAIKSGVAFEVAKEYGEEVLDQYEKHGDDFIANAMRGH